MRMSQTSRRSFQKLTAAALGSLLAIVAIGCAGDTEPGDGAAPATQDAPAEGSGDRESPEGSDAR